MIQDKLLFKAQDKKKIIFKQIYYFTIEKYLLIYY